MAEQPAAAKLKVSPAAAEVVRPGAPREQQLRAARGGLPLPGTDLLTLLLFFTMGADEELKREALQTLRRIPSDKLAAVLGRALLHPRVLDLIARVRLGDLVVMRALLANASLADATLVHVAAQAEPAVLSLLAQVGDRAASLAEVAEALRANPHADAPLLARLIPGEAQEVEPEGDVGEDSSDSEEEEGEPEEEINLSKYQKALEMPVSEKIKTAMTGDKEWRGIFTKDANKLVSSAVLKNPRITDGEILALSKSKSATDDQIRLITLNREWVKKYEIKKALIYHPRTPLPNALRYMNIMNDKDLKKLTQSRGVSAVLVNNARRILVIKEKKK